MTKIAQVIVDVPTMQTDTPFTYLIPLSLAETVQTGMRVVVPFGGGNRKVQGFVLQVLEKTEEELTALGQLKTISEVMDLSPVLNGELLDLAEMMKQTTFSFKITCLQTMLPRVMRADYEKWLVIVDEIPEDIYEQVFHCLDEIPFQEAVSSERVGELKKLKRENKLEVRYEVKARNKKKMVQGFRSLLSFEQAEEAKEDLRKTAHKQRKLLALLQQLEDKVCTLVDANKKYQVSRGVIQKGEENGWLELVEVEVKRDPYAYHTFKPSQPLVLNDEQQAACQAITTHIHQQQHKTFLLQGVTGSGKTEVYLQGIAEALKLGKTAIMLVPEIALTPQTVHRFKSRFGNQVAVLHSALSEGEKYDEWRKIEKKEAQVVVGARSAIFAPLENIGLIILDEEHETSYKQEDTPRYHARNIAIWRGKYHQCPVVLGSATPSLESRARAHKQVYQLLPLTKRANTKATLPSVNVVDMREEITKGSMQSFSETLLEKVQHRLDRKEQVVLMLNRRGYSSFVMCRDCGYVLPCPNCDISLTLHMDNLKMKCHYCGHEENIPKECPICQSHKIRYYGTGTQKVEEELQQLFPTASILRMDVDTTRRKGAHERLLKKFGERKADILLGTQMIAKGLDFPNVTLVGVLNADTALNLPDFRASEKTFQLLTQVSGRAGRGDKPGEVIIQTFNPTHYAIEYAKNQDYELFYRHEMQMRHLGNYPPYFFTVQIVASHEQEEVAARKSFELVRYLKQQLTPQAIVLGPTPKAILRIKNRYYYQLVIKYKQEPELANALRTILEASQKDYRQGLKITIDIEPNSFI